MGIKIPARQHDNRDLPSFRRRLLIVITSIFFVFIVLMAGIIYLSAVTQVMNDFNNTRLQTEKTFVSSALLTEYGVESFDSQYDFLLQDRILQFLHAYQEKRTDPTAVDLEALKKKVSPGAPGDLELFLINKSGVVEYTTYQKDKNIDFSKYPDFFSSLTSIRLGDEFRSDPWIRDFDNSQVYWKYGYLPTDDHEYILEIGLRNENYSRMHTEMITQLRRVATDALNIPGLIHADVYDKAHRKSSIWSDDGQKNRSMSSGSLNGVKLEEVLNRTLESKESSVIDRSDQKQIISVQYINLSTTRSTSGAERSYVGVLVFSTDPIEQLILLYRAGFILITIIALLLALIAARHLSAYISRPIEMMTEDVGIIASSSLSHQVRETGVHETEKLRRSINSLVASIKDYIAEIENQQQELRTELRLRVKAENALEKANKRLTQLSQITRHDILNQITALQIFLEIIPGTTDKQSADEYTGKAQKVLSSITTLLSFTYDYEQIGQDGPAWQNIGNILDDLQDEFSDQIQIEHSCSGVEILADRLIKKVFYNLIDNTIRHGAASTVTVSFEEKDSGYLIYQDDGCGIEESDKERIFSRGYGRGTGIGMAFIREVLESDDITIRENGDEGKGARFEIGIPPDHYRIIET